MKINFSTDMVHVTCIGLFIILFTNTAFSSNSFPQANGMEGLVPRLEPTQHISSNPNLYVSAENPLFKNYFAGPQVIEVSVSDPDINRLDQAYGEPIVTINGKRLRMAQATDGNWYAYFADRNQAIIAANTAALTGKGLNFGAFCYPTSTFSPKAGVTYAETDGFTLARGGFGSVNHTAAFTITSSNFGTCTNVQGILTSNQMEHVVRQNKTLNGNPLGFNANSGAYPSVWPVIQLYEFPAIPSTVIVDYQKNGGDQIVNLVFDRIPGNIIKGVANRPDFPQGAQVQADLIDPQLNIDPTEEDSWTWGTSTTNNTVFYQTFSRNGQPDADGTLGMQDVSGNLTAMMFNHNGKLTTIPRPQGVQVVEAQSNGIQKVFQDSNGKYRTLSISGASGPITLLEIQPNVGIFADYDASGIADLKILDNAKRDTSFIAKYNDISYSLVVKFHSAKLTMGWPEGQTGIMQDTRNTMSSQPEERPSHISFLVEYILKNIVLL